MTRLLPAAYSSGFATRGLLVQEGVRGGAAYRISSDLERSHAHLSVAEVDALVLKMAREVPVTNAILRERTGLSRPQALAVLSRLGCQ